MDLILLWFLYRVFIRKKPEDSDEVAMQDAEVQEMLVPYGDIMYHYMPE